jgi:hypothetical protein
MLWRHVGQCSTSAGRTLARITSHRIIYRQFKISEHSMVLIKQQDIAWLHIAMDLSLSM